MGMKIVETHQQDGEEQKAHKGQKDSRFALPLHKVSLVMKKDSL